MFASVSIAVVGCVIFALIRYYVKWWRFYRRFGIRGPFPYPFLGNIVGSANPGLLINDRNLIEKYGKVFPIMRGWGPGIVVADPILLKQLLLKNFDHFMDRASPSLLPFPLSLNLLQLQGAKWKKIRQIVTPTFTSGKLKTIFPLITAVTKQITNRLDEAIEKNEHTNLRKLFGYFTASTITSMAFGLNTEESTAQERVYLAQLFDEAIDAINNRNWRLWIMMGVPFLNTKPGNDGKSVMSMIPESKVRDLLRLLNRVYSERLGGSKRADFFQMLMEARLRKDDDPSDSSSSSKLSTEKHSKDELMGQAGLFLFAGYETTMTALSYATFLLAQHPDVQEKCAQEVEDVLVRDGAEKLNYEHIGNMPYLEAVLRESLRLFTPIRRFFRECNEDINVGGMDFRRGDIIVIPAHAIHRLPELWGSDVDSFNPDRFFGQSPVDMAYQAFGSGQRSCIGERLAILESKALLAAILPHYRFVPGSETVIPPRMVANTFLTREHHDLLLRVEKRK